MLPEVESLRVQEFVAYPQGRSHTFGLSIMNSKARFTRILLAQSAVARSIYNVHNNDFISRYIECATSCKRKIHFRSCCEG